MVISGEFTTDSHRSCGGVGCAACNRTGKDSVARFYEAKAKDERHFIATAQQMVEVAKALDAGVKPKGLDSPIAIQMALEAEKKELLEKIQAGHAALTPKPDEAFEGRLPFAARLNVRDGIQGLEAYLPSAPGTIFGIDRRAPTCSVPGCNTDVSFEDFCDNTQELHDTFGLEGSKVRLCRVHRPVPKPRQPAIPGVTQHKARPGVSYRLYDNSCHDDVLIVAESMENPGWGRQVLVPGQLFTIWKRRTNPPPGEVALTDDDLETIINEFDLRPMHFQPWTPVEEDEDEDTSETAAEYEALKREFFFTDLELQAHVAKCLDIPFDPDAESGPQFGEKMHAALEHAWGMATAWGYEPRKHTLETLVMVRSARRASRVLSLRKREE